jgi:hypothetical protein
MIEKSDIEKAYDKIATLHTETMAELVEAMRARDAALKMAVEQNIALRRILLLAAKNIGVDVMIDGVKIDNEELDGDDE